MRASIGFLIVALYLSLTGTASADLIPSVEKFRAMNQAERIAFAGTYRRATCPRLGPPSAEEKRNAWKITLAWDPSQVTNYIDEQCRVFMANAK